jgi:hypothetical protein
MHWIDYLITVLPLLICGSDAAVAVIWLVSTVYLPTAMTAQLLTELVATRSAPKNSSCNGSARHFKSPWLHFSAPD